MYKALRGQTSGTFEIRTLNKRDYLVVPVVAMIEGVLLGANSSGGELGLAVEFAKFPDGWNNRPIVLSHPKVDDQYVSAGHPQVMEDFSFGMTFATHLDGKKLKMEAWLDMESRDKSDGISEMFTRIEAEEIIEVSVGFFTEVEDRKGTFKGQKYQAVWRNVVPDHLAFLQEGEIGACSVEDGCGTPRTNKAKEVPVFDKLKNKVTGKNKPKAQSEPGKSTLKVACSCDNTPEPNVRSLSLLAVEDGAVREDLVLNHNDQEAIRELLVQTIAPELLSRDVLHALQVKMDEIHVWPWVISYTTTHVIFSAQMEMSGAWQTFRQAFDINADGEVTLTGDPEKVRIISRIVPVTDVNPQSSNPEEEEMTNPTAKTPAAQEDAGTTPATPGTPATPATPSTPASPTTPATPATPTNNAAAPTVPAVQAEPKKQLTAQEYVEQAPAEVKEVLQSSMALLKRQKDELIANLKKSGRCQFDDAYLASQSLETLTSLAALADVPSYAGVTAPVTQGSAEGSEFVPAPKCFVKKTAAAA